jgi:hypothetical protein
MAWFLEAMAKNAIEVSQDQQKQARNFSNAAENSEFHLKTTAR